jgi:GntR family transcriptional regulator
MTTNSVRGDMAELRGESRPDARWRQVQEALRRLLESGGLSPGTSLPSERELCQRFGFSRITIRKAVDGLVAEGLIQRRHGAGTFVSRTPPPAAGERVEKSFASLSSFSEDMTARGRQPASHLLTAEEGTVMPEEALALSLSPGSKVWRFRRVRSASGESMALEHAVIPGWGLPGLEAVGSSLYAALERAGNRPVRALQRVRAVSFSPEQASLLGVAPGDPALMIERRGFLPDGRLIELTTSWYRGDAYDLVAELGG